MFHGAVTPIMLLKLVSKGKVDIVVVNIEPQQSNRVCWRMEGIDIFDSTFPWMVAERGGALIFPNSLLKKE